MENQPDLQESINELVHTNKILVHQQSYWRAFGRGVITGLGASVGAVLILAVVGGILRNLVTVDFIRPAVEAVLPYFENSAMVRPTHSNDTDLPSVSYTSPSPSPETSPISEQSPVLEDNNNR